MILLLLFNSMGYYLLYEANRAAVKREMRALIRTIPKKVTRLAIHASELKSLQRPEGHEIRYHGAMYDVIREEQSGDSLVFYCLRDFKEELLASGLKRVANSRISLLLKAHIIILALPEGSLPTQIIFPESVCYPDFFPPLSPRITPAIAHPPELS